MRKILVSFLTATALVSVSSLPTVLTHSTNAQQKPIPPYAKWGRVAMERTHKKYPNAQIVDYLHIGRTPGANSSVEKFKLWLKEGQREFGVFIDIQFENKTEKIQKVTFKESTR
ncbi:YqzG/YhdC family protein [Neobacillus citreus]|uniref:YqzG/YhdC family protein n=1 Tax=Neobacillus citreus TaxID=2833578 RepID=A0A942T7T3_9BACI|nr:YqzG/YhdC family protein [Neobacillus citreus]MCH6269521.1 YqzG/YhdC family protein [Neobacillus citreus]